MSSRGRRRAGDLSGRLMRTFLLVVASALFIVTWATPSHAYPWMLRHGYAKCASCHTDPMGGETLTGFGRVISDTTLSTRWDGSKEPTNKAQLFFGVTEPRDLRLGGSIRYMDALYTFPKDGAEGKFTSFPMQIDTYGQVRLFEKLRISGDLGVTHLRKGSQYSRAAFVTKNAEDEFNVLSRSHWVGYDVTDNILIRAGRMNLPFGMRIPEHVMFARQATRTDRESNQQHGVAASYSGGRLRAEVMGILGNYQISPDKFRERGYSAYGEYLLSNSVALGVSSMLTSVKQDRLRLGVDDQPVTRQAHGVTGRFGFGPVALLAEADVLLASRMGTGYVGMLQADYEFLQGFHALLTGEAVDGGKPQGTTTTVAGSGEPQFRGWLSFGWFFFTHFDARMDLVVTQNAPTTFQSQIHWYF